MDTKIQQRESSTLTLPKRVGIYGGSFNPVHFGHMGLAKWVIEHTDLDELWMLVTPNNPLKPAGMLAPEQERLAAVREAVKDIPGVRASDFEFSLPRPSYTANTLRALQTAYPDYEFTLVIGEDNLAIIDHWREYEFILSRFRIFVYPRHATDGSAIPEGQSSSSLINGCSQFADVKDIVFLTGAPYFDISSTAIRQAKR